MPTDAHHATPHHHHTFPAMADPKIKYDIEAAVSGEADAQKLAAELRNVGDVLEGDLQQSALDAAQALESLGAKQRALAEFARLKREAEDMAAALGTATRVVNDLGNELPQASANTQALANAERAMSNALADAQASLARKKEALKQLREETTGAARRTDEFKAAEAGLKTAISATTAEVKTRKTDLTSTTQGLAQATAAEAALNKEYQLATEAASKASVEVGNLTRKLDESRSALNAVGISTTSLVQANRSLQSESARVADQINAHNAAQEKAALSAKALADANEVSALRAKADAAAYANWWKNALADQDAANEKTIASMRRQIQAAKDTSNAIQAAFGTVGARSVEELQAQITKTEQAMRLLAKSGALTGPELKVAMAQGEAAIAGLKREIREATGQLTLMDKATNAWNQSVGGIKVGTLLAVGAINSLFQKATELGGAFVTAVTANERLVQSLNNIHKDGNLATSQISLLRKSANEAGISVTDLQQSFVKYSAAMTGANIPLSQSNALFTALTKAGGSLGLSTDSVNRAMEALGQMASKGTVSMEELRQQLGDALPGALGLAAKGLGLTESEVISLVSSGQLAAKDFFPAFTTGLASVSGEASTLTQNFERLKNNISAVFIAIGDAGALDVMKAALFGVAELAKVVGATFVVLAEGISNTIRISAAAAGAIAGGGGLKGAWEAVNQVASESRDRMERLGQELYGTETATKAVTVVATANATALSNMDAASAGASKALIALNLAVGAEADKLAHASKMAEENAKAVDTTVAVNIKAAKGIGDVTQAIDAEIAAHGAAVTALEALATARINELKLLQEQFAATKLLLEADGLLDKADQDRLLAIAQEIEKRAGVVKGIEAKIAASKQDLAQSEIEKEMLSDNSSRMYELIDRYSEATEAVKNLRDEKVAGKDVDAELTAAIEKQSNAYKLANDAANDSVKAEQAKLVAIKASNAVTDASLQLQLNSAKSLESLANATGNYTLAIRAKVAQMEIEIKMSQAKAAALKAEADAEESIAGAKMKVMELSGKIDPVQKAELEGVSKISDAKRIQAKAIEETTGIIQREINALNSGAGALNSHAGAAGKAAAAQDSLGRNTTDATAALEQQNAALERNISAQEKANDLKERAGALDRKAKNVDKDGYTLDASGNRQQVSMNTPMERAFKDGYVKRDNNGNYDPDEMRRALIAIDEKDKLSEASIRDGVRAGAGGGGTASSPATAAGVTAKTYNVQIGGRTVKTTSDADAQSLIAALKDARMAA